MNKNAQEKKPGIKELWGKLYYLILLVVVSALLMSQSGPRVVGGYGIFTVLTGSMQSVIPQGSLVITKAVDASTIEIGDDITFMNSPTTTITHRVVEIIEDVDEMVGTRAFTTQGVDNAAPDKSQVRQENLVGKVIWHNHSLGKALTMIEEYWISMVVYLVLFLILYNTMIWWLEREKKETGIPGVDPVELESQRILGEMEDYLYYQAQRERYVQQHYQEQSYQQQQQWSQVQSYQQGNEYQAQPHQEVYPHQPYEKGGDSHE